MVCEKKSQLEMCKFFWNKGESNPKEYIHVKRKQVKTDWFSSQSNKMVTPVID